MGNWTNKTVVLEPIEFDGDKIVFTVKRLLVEDMQVLSRFYDNSSGNLQFSSPLDVCKTAQEVFPKYVQAINGMSKEDGSAMTVEEFMEASKEFYFITLIGQLFAGLIAASTVKSKEKNSAPPSVES
jgi:hypothetical protein